MVLNKLLRSDKKPSDKQPKQSSQAIITSTAKPSLNLVDYSLAVNAQKSPSGFADNTPVKLANNSTDNVELAVGAAYKQVFGNTHLMESERLPQIESQLRSGQITVKEFVGELAKSEKYRSLFWDNNSNIKAIELNFKHLLGRSPENYEEISQHIEIIAEDGFEAEIDSYLNSEEYIQNYGETIVPYYRGYTTQAGNNLAGFIYSVQSSKVSCSSDKSSKEVASLKLLATKPKSISIPRGIPASYPVPVILPSDSTAGAPEPIPSKGIPAEILQMARDIQTSTSTYRRPPASIDKKFLDMARNLPYHLR